MDSSEYGIFDRNLRMVKKAKCLCEQICKRLNEDTRFKGWQEVLAKKDLLIFSTYALQEVLTGKFSKLYENKKEEAKKDNRDGYGYWPDFYNDEDKKSRIMSFKIQAITGSIFGRNPFIEPIIDIALEEDYISLDELIVDLLKQKKANDENKQIFEASLFFESDEGRVLLIEQQIKYILGVKVEDASLQQIQRFVGEWYDCYDSEKEFIRKYETTLFEKLYLLNIDRFNYFIFKGQSEFASRYFEFRREHEQVSKKKEIVDLSREELASELHKHSNAGGWNPEITTLLKQAIIENNYYIDGLYGKMKEMDWGIAHSICSLTKTYFHDDVDYREGLLKFLKEYKKKYPNDNTCRKRIDSLIGQYFRNVNVEE